MSDATGVGLYSVGKVVGASLS